MVTQGSLEQGFRLVCHGGLMKQTLFFSFVFHWIWIPSLLVKLPTSSFDDLLLRCCRARFAINLATLAGDFPLKGSWKHVAGMPLLPSGPTQGSPSCKFGHPGQRQQYFFLRFYFAFSFVPLKVVPLNVPPISVCWYD